jgi:hypothetical protein
MASPSAELAEGILRSFGMWKIPVDPFRIVEHEGIFLSPGVYGERFDARIEYYRDVDNFCIFYEEPAGWRTEGRVKFSIAHELGHFYLPAHRQRLRSGNWHNSVSDFASRDEAEAEADEFAADLLMPMDLFRKELDRFRLGFCDLDDLFTLANRLGTSITSTARRYCESDREACTIFFSRGGRIWWNRFSEDMRRLGLYFYPYDTAPPTGSKTAEFWEQAGAGTTPERLSGRVASHVWFQWPKRDYLWEEVAALGNTGRVITQLTPDD